MNKKLINRVGALALCLCACASGLVGCKKPDISRNNNHDEQIDSTKTQLYVYNYDGGYRTDWLYAAKERYEALHAEDTNWETGKKGVQIYVNPPKMGIDANKVKSNRDEIYFAEDVPYFGMQDVMGDITPALTTENPYDNNKKVVDKFTEAQKNYYGVKDSSGNMQYYGVPNYAGYFGIAYNIDLFEEKQYYIKDGVTEFSADNLYDCFVHSDTEKKSAGPDGEYGTSDDGLPVTYTEFYALCDYISQMGQTPFEWSGQFYEKHLTGLLFSLVAQNEGSQQMMLTYDASGTASTLGSVQNGMFVKDSVSTPINSSNAYELARRKGTYDGIEFIRRLITTSAWQNEDAFKTSVSHMNAQEKFLKAGKVGNDKPIAMLVDGVWWESEATATFDSMTKSKGEAYSKNNRNFGWMPLPKAEKDDTHTNTLIDDMYSLCFMKKDIEDWKKPLAYDFIQFMYSDESLAEFSTITNTPKALTYTMSEEDKAKMSPYGRSLIEMKENSDVVYPISRSSLFANNQSTFRDSRLFTTKIDGKIVSSPAKAFHEGNTDSTEICFNGIYDYFKNNLTIWG